MIGLLVFSMGCPDIFDPENGGNGQVDVALGPPTNLKAVSKTNSIELNWDEIINDSLKGYNIYRSLNPGKDYGKINNYPITGNSYRDEGLTGGITYYYVVTSITKTEKESNYSVEVNAKPIVIGDTNTDAPYLELCNKEATQLKKDQCLNDYAIQYNDISACREMQQLSVDNCVKEIAVNLQSYDTCKEIKLKNITIRDQCFYEIAIALEDTTGCNQIIDSSKSNTCNAIVAGTIGSIEACKKISIIKDKDICFKTIAESTKNFVVCTYISTAKTTDIFKRDDCLNTILASIKEEAMCEYYLDKTEKNNCYKVVGISEKNPVICNKATDQNTTDYCIKEIAITEQDSDYCLQIKDTDVFQECVIAIAEVNPYKKVCELILDLSTKDNCYYNTAKAVQDDSFCGYILENEIRDTCYYDLAVDLNNSLLCDKIRSLNNALKNSCYSSVALNSLNSPLCEKVTGSDTYVDCYKNIAVELEDYSICNSASKRFPLLVYLTPDYCFYKYAEDTNNSLACEQINNLTYRNDCDVNALS